MRSKYKILGVLYLVIISFILLSTFQRDSVMVSGLFTDSSIIVIDAGHGGVDPGCSKGEILEKDINLAISQKLVQYLQAGGLTVLTTRDSDVEVYPKNETDTWRERWQKDLEKRLDTAIEGQASLMVSIHVNSMANSKWRGAQVFYGAENEESKELASLIQSQFVEVLANTTRVEKAGDYYLTKALELPVVIAEVGFLSNPSEAELLQQESYQDLVAWSIYRGIVMYLARVK